jgi:hypothetical protein
MRIAYSGMQASNSNLRSLILRKKGKGKGNDRTEDDSMWNKKRLIGLGELGYTTEGDTMEVKRFMDRDFVE